MTTGTVKHVYTYATGYRTREAAELAILAALEESQISAAERPRVRMYRSTIHNAYRYRIELSH